MIIYQKTPFSIPLTLPISFSSPASKSTLWLRYPFWCLQTYSRFPSSVLPQNLLFPLSQFPYSAATPLYLPPIPPESSNYIHSARFQQCQGGPIPFYTFHYSNQPKTRSISYRNYRHFLNSWPSVQATLTSIWKLS